MNMFFSGINRKLLRVVIAAPLIVFIIFFTGTGNTSTHSESDKKFTVFKADFDITPSQNQNSDEKLVKDFYINGGEKDGIDTSTVLDVYREKIVHDRFQGNETTISILIGQIRVIEAFETVAITRITNLVYSEKTPVLQYQSIMIGDYAVPQKKKKTSPTLKPAPKLSGALPSPAVKDSKKPSKLYSMIPVSARSGDLSAPGVSFPSQVLFEFDDWRLKPEAVTALAEVMNLYNKARDRQIIIEGHTCSFGEHGYNITLSKKRAQSVSNFLTSVMGLPAENIRIEYYGELFPVAPNTDESGREKNRRVDIRFLPLTKNERLLQSLVKK